MTKPITPRMRVRDLWSEAVAALLARPARAVLTALGTVLGIVALVGTLGLAATAGNRIVGRFDELSATEVRVKPTSSFFESGPKTSSIPFDSGKRLARLNGVIAAGTLSDVDLGGALVRTVPIADPLAAPEQSISVKAVSTQTLAAERAVLQTGTPFTELHDRDRMRVAILGSDAAEELGVSRVDNQPGIFIGDRVYSVIAILDDVSRDADLLSSILIPNGAAQEDWGLKAPAEVLIETEVGAAQLIARQAPAALNPNAPNELRSAAPPEPKRTKAGIKSDLQSLLLVLGGVSLIIGAIGIANVTLVSVIERVGEIGLRRALGASRRHIAGQFLMESMALGVVGGIAGASLGTLLVVIVSAVQDWTPVIAPWIPFAAPVLGALVGLVAGLYPAMRAARLEPVEALRSGM